MLTGWPQAALRMARVCVVAGRHGLLHLVSRSREETGPGRLKMALEEVGGAYLKLGQVLSLQPDVLIAAKQRLETIRREGAAKRGRKVLEIVRQGDALVLRIDDQSFEIPGVVFTEGS